MSRSARGHYDVSKRNSDGYKPTRVPNALKVISGKMIDSLEVVKMTEQSGKVSSGNTIKNRIVDIYISCENEKRAEDWYLNVLGLSSLVMENGSRLLLMEWGENHKPIVDGAVFSLQAPDIHKAHSELKARGAKVDEEVAQFGAQILIIDQAS